MLKATPNTQNSLDLGRFAGDTLFSLFSWQARTDPGQPVAGLDHRLMKDVGVTRSQFAKKGRKLFWRR